MALENLTPITRLEWFIQNAGGSGGSGFEPVIWELSNTLNTEIQTALTQAMTYMLTHSTKSYYFSKTEPSIFADADLSSMTSVYAAVSEGKPAYISSNQLGVYVPVNQVANAQGTTAVIYVIPLAPIDVAGLTYQVRITVNCNHSTIGGVGDQILMAVEILYEPSQT